jgi:EAL domain-containing protein (putative c-di-GMP-specific phosphodiesterase class I)
VITTEAGAVALTVSIGGVALPRHGRTVNEAMARAQEGLHVARLRGNGHFGAYVHSTARSERRRDNAALSTELVTALNERRLKLAYQPVVDVATRAPVFHEALLRLERPDGSILPAHEFIGLSERLGLIRLIDHRVLDLAGEALAGSPATRLSLNISADTIADSEWLAHLSAAIAGDRSLAQRLTIEITETAVIRNLEEAQHLVTLLHDLGCRVAIDDFGAGFSSFRHLRVLDIDLIKIDGGFVEALPRNRDDQVFVRTLIELARNFDIKTVAEWVTDEGTAEILADWGVDYIQGNLTGAAGFDRPVAARPN